jgi:hypothetical protein
MWYAPGMALADHKIDQFSLQTEAGHKSRGGAGVVGADEEHRLNYGLSFGCKFAADAASRGSPIQLTIAALQRRLWRNWGARAFPTWALDPEVPGCQSYGAGPS